MIGANAGAPPPYPGEEENLPPYTAIATELDPEAHKITSWLKNVILKISTSSTYEKAAGVMCRALNHLSNLCPPNNYAIVFILDSKCQLLARRMSREALLSTISGGA